MRSLPSLRPRLCRIFIANSLGRMLSRCRLRTIAVLGSARVVGLASSALVATLACRESSTPGHQLQLLPNQLNSTHHFPALFYTHGGVLRSGIE